MTGGVAGKGSAGMTPIALSFQRVMLESGNFIRLVSINVTLKYTILWKLDPSIKYWDDKKRATWMTRREHWNDGRRGYLDDRGRSAGTSSNMLA